MCDANSVTSHITSEDIKAAQLYARMKLLREKTLALSQNVKDVQWVDRFADKSTSYRCPNGLTCYEGGPRIMTLNECKRMNKYDISKPPGPQNGWYLEWRDNNCYLGNFWYRQKCDCNFGDYNNDTKQCEGSAKGKLRWYDDDATGGKCLITQDYCSNYGYNNYEPGPYTNGDGGNCAMTTGENVVDFIFGDTITRGLFYGNACTK